MQVSVEKTSNLGRRLTIQVPEQKVAAEEKSSLQNLAKTMKIDGGFRPGSKEKAAFIQKQYGKQIRSEAISRVVEVSLGEALREQNLRPANTPNVEDLKDEKGQNITYTVSFEVYPEINLDFAKVEVEKEVAEITDADIDVGVKRLQDQFATWGDVTGRATQLGDKVTIDFVGLLNGEPFEHGSAENFDLELGSKQFIPGFEDGLVGVTIGADKTLDLTFPADYGAENLAGKTVQFNVKVKNIQAKTPAELNEEFAARIGIEDKDVSKVRDKIRENMVKYLEDVTKSKMREQALEKIYTTNTFDLPESIVEREKHGLLHEKYGQHGHNTECKDVDHKESTLTEEQKTELNNEARKRVALGLLLNEIIVKNKMQPEKDRVLAKIRSMALMYGGHTELIQKMYMESKELRQNIENMVLTDQAADLILAGATIKEKQSSFYGIVDGKTE